MTKYLGFQYSDLSGDFFTFQQDNALPTESLRPRSCELAKNQISSLQLYGQPTVLTWTP